MRLSFWLTLLPAAHVAAAQATVRGTVYDSVASVPLAQATVQLVAADDPAKFARSSATDSIGRFSFADVPDGRYMLGFMHPRLDTLGIDPPAREIRVSGHDEVDLDLAIPGAAQLVRAICGDRTKNEAGGVVMGVVRDARTRQPIANVSVAGEWFDFILAAQGTARRPRRLVATTHDSGWFGICDVPAGGSVSVIASRGADSARIDLDVPAGGFLHRDVYLPSGTRTARVTGVVIAAASNRPLSNAEVTFDGTGAVRTNALGQFALSDAPLGTRSLEVRAVGYYPEHRTIDVLDGMAPQRLVLSTMKAVLDTVRIRAAGGNADLAAFESRRRTLGTGTFVTRDEITRRNPVRVTELFRTMSGIRVARGVREPPTASIHDTTSLLVEGASGRAWCQPLVFVDGKMFERMTADELDDLISPRDIGGIEVYTGITAPPQFQVPLGGCGSIVIWRR